MNDIQSDDHPTGAPNKPMIVLAWAAILILSTPTIILRSIVPDLPAEPLVPY